MPLFSTRSLERLGTCHPDLQYLFNEVVRDFDCTILCGHRPEEDQNEAFEHGFSTKPWPESTHNKKPSKAVDVAPYPVEWDNRERFYYFAGYVKGKAVDLGIKIRWGGDWDGDTRVKDQTFNDLPHFELIEG